MPLDPGRVAAELESEADRIRAYLDEDSDTIARYREVIADQRQRPAGEIEADLSNRSHPGALPTAEWDRHEGLAVPFAEIHDWDSHEAVNRWARRILEETTTIAVDGSEAGPTTEFNVPLGLVQAAWCVNHHTPDGDYEHGVVEDVVPPQALVRQNNNNVTYIDGDRIGHARYEHEAAVVVDRIEAYADREPAPVVLYDGPLIISFVNAFRPEPRERYVEAMSRILAASRHHEVPIVGYVAGSEANEVARMLRALRPDALGDADLPPDRRIIEPEMSPWGDRSLVFQSRRDESLDRLGTVYKGTEYRFATDMLFAYLDAPGPGALDRLEFPRWIFEAGDLERTIDVVRAEAAVGRGYPEILKQADADAVLTSDDYDRLLRTIQQFADANDIPLDWDEKALSKNRRRR